MAGGLPGRDPAPQRRDLRCYGPCSGRPGNGRDTDWVAAGEVRDPVALEVHRPVQPDIPQVLPALPAYVPREHDGALARWCGGGRGHSGIAVLVGGSSTGKTRACWEALELLRARREWRLWHPIDPSRPEAALRELPAIGPRTVVWLNEAQLYLDTPGGDGGTGRGRVAGAAARPGPGPGAGAGHAVAAVLGYADRPPGGG